MKIVLFSEGMKEGYSNRLLMENKYAIIAHCMRTGKVFQGTIGQSNNTDFLFKAFFMKCCYYQYNTGVLC